MSSSKRWVTSCTSPVSAAILILASGPAFSQIVQPAREGPSATDTDLEEIVVTAEKRDNTVQRTALSITALSGDELQRRQITDLLSLQATLPNVRIAQTSGIARISIRGLGYDLTGAGQEQRAAFHVDGVYIARSPAILAGFYDLERIEVLRGPQGTLYGRNATSGAINVITRNPTSDLDGYLTGEVGNYGLLRLEGGVGGPLAEGIDGRIAFQSVDRGGYGTNLVTDRKIDNQHTKAVRGKLKFDLGGGWRLNLGADYFRERDRAFALHYFGQGNPNVTVIGLTPRFGGFVPADRRDIAGDDPQSRRHYWGGRAELTGSFGGLDFISLTAYRNNYSLSSLDLDTTSVQLATVYQLEKGHQFSQEFRLNGSSGDFEWLLGAYYFGEHVFGGNHIPIDRRLRLANVTPLIVQGSYGRGSLDTDAYAGFGQVRYSISEALVFNVGVRYSTEKKKLDEAFNVGNGPFDVTRPFPPLLPPNGPTFQDSNSWNAFTPKLTLEYSPAEDVLTYATFSKGFKSGGFNVGGTVQPAFNPEKLTDYEVGLKFTTSDRKLRGNFAAFYYSYSNLQVNQVTLLGTAITNAASATLKGIEGEISILPIARLRLDVSGGYTHSQYDTFFTGDSARPQLGILDLSGNRLTNAPRYTVNVSARYTLPTSVGDLTLRGEGSWVDRTFFSPFNLEASSASPHSKFNAYIDYESPSKGWTATAYIKNIANKDIISSSLVSTGVTGFPIIGALEPPRTVGLQLTRLF